MSAPPNPTPAISRRRALALCGGAAACAFGAGVAVDRITDDGPGTAVDRLLRRTPRTTNDHLRLAAEPDAVFGVETGDPVVALSFDDGPDGRYTQQVLDLLDAHDARATFFQVGVNALAHPDLVLGVRGAGHSIGNHTRSHQALDRLATEEAFEEILGGAADLRAAGAPAPDLVRPPYGLTDDVIGAFVSAEACRSVYWTTSVEHELSGRSVAEGARRIVEEVRPGDILLAHDGSGAVGLPEDRRTDRSRTMAALPLLLTGLRERGIRVVDVPELLERGPRRDRSSIER